MRTSVAKLRRVFFRGVTWNRDSHGLFDYESRNINKKNIKTQSIGKLVRINDDVELVALARDLTDYGEQCSPLLQLRFDERKFPHFLFKNLE